MSFNHYLYPSLVVSCDRRGCLVKPEVGGVVEGGGVWWEESAGIGLGGVVCTDVGVVTLGD